MAYNIVIPTYSYETCEGRFEVDTKIKTGTSEKDLEKHIVAYKRWLTTKKGNRPEEPASKTETFKKGTTFKYSLSVNGTLNITILKSYYQPQVGKVYTLGKNDSWWFLTDKGIVSNQVELKLVEDTPVASNGISEIPKYLMTVSDKQAVIERFDTSVANYLIEFDKSVSKIRAGIEEEFKEYRGQLVKNSNVSEMVEEIANYFDSSSYVDLAVDIDNLSIDNIVLPKGTSIWAYENGSQFYLSDTDIELYHPQMKVEVA